MKKGQVIVQGITKEGKPGLIDILNLDDESFRAYTIDRLICGGLIIPLQPKDVEGSPIKYKERLNNV